MGFSSVLNYIGTRIMPTRGRLDALPINPTDLLGLLQGF
jgi:hypothetical protein